MLRGDIAGAISRYQESIAADPTFAEAHTQLAIAYERLGRGDEAGRNARRRQGLARRSRILLHISKSSGDL